MGMKLILIPTLVICCFLCSCKAGEIVKVDRPASYGYSGPPPGDLSLKDYSRIIISRFQVFDGVDAANTALEFPQAIYNKINFYHPTAFEDVRLWQYDKPGLLLTGYIVECNISGRSRRITPNANGSAVLGVEIILQDNLSGREIAKFSYRHPYHRPDMSFEDVVDATAREVAGYLAYCRKH